MTVLMNRFTQIVIDIAALACSFALAFVVRFDGIPDAAIIGRFFLITPYVVAYEYLTLRVFGIHRFSWRYVGLREGLRITTAALVFSLALALSRIVAGELQEDFPYLRHGIIPFGVIAANFMFSIFAIAGVRFLRRILGERSDVARASNSMAPPGSKQKRILLVGAGQAGVLVAKELAQRPELNLMPAGFVDDDASKVGTEIHGIRVLGTTNMLADIARRRRVDEALITMANVPGDVIRRIRGLCTEAELPVKIIPGIYEIVDGKVNLSRIREVAIEDLLGRDPVQLDYEAVARSTDAQVVMVTGAGGSIGSEICRQLCRFSPSKLVLVERTENALFEIHRELSHTFPEETLIPIIADIGDETRMRQVMETYRPRRVYHAAAHKHVPLMEENPGEAVKNNVLGTQVIARLSSEFGVEAFVMISTDKAVNPTSVMGASKRVAELVVQDIARHSKTRFVTVRFGNVLGSAGSVIPIFKKQIAAGGPVTVTHPEMTRYFMTIPEACQLVLQAGTMGQGSEIFILDMGEPVKIVDLAHDLIRLSGFRVEQDIKIEFTGTRPGEKLFEELSTDHEHADKTKHPKIFIGRIEALEAPELERGLQRTVRAAEQGDIAAVKESLRALVPEFRSAPSQPPPAPARLSPSPLAKSEPAFEAPRT